MLKSAGGDEAGTKRSFSETIDTWHNPIVGIVVTHFNYSHVISDALLSVQQQNYRNFRCVVVDDLSDKTHVERLERILAELNDPRFSLIRNDTNLGQIPSFYRGMDELDVEFVTLLDPDDRYKPDFVERMLRLHHNPFVLCPVVTCDQDLLRLGDGVVARNKNRVINAKQPCRRTGGSAKRPHSPSSGSTAMRSRRTGVGSEYRRSAPSER